MIVAHYYLGSLSMFRHRVGSVCLVVGGGVRGGCGDQVAPNLQIVRHWQFGEVLYVARAYWRCLLIHGY